MRPSSAWIFGSTTGARLGEHLLDEAVAHVGAELLELLVRRRFEPGDELLELVFAHLLLQHRADGRRRQPTARSRTSGYRLVDVLADLGLDRLADRLALLDRHLALHGQAGLLHHLRRPAARRCCARRSRSRAAAACSIALDQLLLRARRLRAGAALRQDEREHDAGRRRRTARGAMLIRRLLRGAAPVGGFVGSPLASFSTMRCRPISLAPSSRAIRVTPCVARPISRISATRVRTSTPLSVISMISSSGRTSVAATTLPLRSRLLDRDHALGAAAVAGVFGDRRALAVAVLGGGQHALRLVLGHQHRDHALAVARAPCRARRARCGPSARTSFSSKRTALPPSREQHHVVLAVGERGADQEVARRRGRPR